MQKNPILVVDNDKDDIELIQAAVEELQIDRPVLYFEGGGELLEYLKTSPEAPFLILCDVNLRGQDGFEVRQQIADDPATNYRSVPFIFWANGASDKQIQFAYDLPAQGFFIKPDSYQDLCDTFNTIVHYWEKSQHPKKVS